MHYLKSDINEFTFGNSNVKSSNTCQIFLLIKDCIQIAKLLGGAPPTLPLDPPGLIKIFCIGLEILKVGIEMFVL